jgi:hypothetical protein
MKKKVLALLLIFSVVTVLGEAVFPADGVAEKRKRILNYLRSLPEKSEGKLLSGLTGGVITYRQIMAGGRLVFSMCR